MFFKWVVKARRNNAKMARMAILAEMVVFVGSYTRTHPGYPPSGWVPRGASFGTLFWPENGSQGIKTSKKWSKKGTHRMVAPYGTPGHPGAEKWQKWFHTGPVCPCSTPDP